MTYKIVLLAYISAIKASYVTPYPEHGLLSSPAPAAIVPAYHSRYSSDILAEIYDQHVPAHYSYEYGVADAHTGDVKSQYETREGDVVKGCYALNEADGTKRIVRYTVDPHNGFNAYVERVGHAVSAFQDKVVHAESIATAPISQAVYATYKGHEGYEYGYGFRTSSAVSYVIASHAFEH